MMNLALWYFIVYVVVFVPLSSPPIKGKTLAYFYRSKAQCQRVLKIMEKEISKMDVEPPEEGGAKAILGTKCRQVKIAERGLKRGYKSNGLHL